MQGFDLSYAEGFLFSNCGGDHVKTIFFIAAFHNDSAQTVSVILKVPELRYVIFSKSYSKLVHIFETKLDGKLLFWKGHVWIIPLSLVSLLNLPLVSTWQDKW